MTKIRDAIAAAVPALKPLLPGAYHDPILVKLTVAQDVEGMRQLLANGADVDESKPDGRPAVWWATTVASTEPLRLLLEHHAKVNMPAGSKHIPLVRAAISGRVDACRILLDAGADPNVRINGKPILSSLCESSYDEVVTLLIERGADVHATDDAGGQAIHVAARNRATPEMIEVLLRAGADVNSATESGDGRSPLELALRSRANKVVAALLNAGAAVPKELDEDVFWDDLYDCIYTNRQEEDFLAVQRLVRAALLAQNLSQAMKGGASETMAARSSTPGLL